MIIDHMQKRSLDLAINALNNDHIFVYPTDTIYGFGGDARSESVIEKLYAIKNRPEHMPVSMLVPDLEMLREYAYTSDKVKKLAEHFLPGALTLVLPAKEIELPEQLFSAQGFLGFRIPDHVFCRDLSKTFNAPIITTSVNLSGQAALNKISDIEKQFADKVDVFISDKALESKTGAKGSTVIMITKDDELKILREGIVSEKDILLALG